MRRRNFIAGLGGAAAAWPRAARPQQPKVPVIGFLAEGPNGPNRWGASFHQGLKEAGCRRPECGHRIPRGAAVNGSVQ